jgi:O-antigen/teichoic acid export membrane protein
LDVFLIGLILKDTNILASYKTATLIPFGLNFIPLSIMIFSGPYFTKMSQNYEDLRYYYMKLKKSLFLLNCFICLGLYIFASDIIIIFFGDSYIDSITIFKVLVVGYFIAGTFRIPNGNLIASIGKVKLNLFVAIVSSIFNVILDIILIPKYGSLGAAIATVSVFIVSSLITEAYLIKTFNLKIRDLLNFI